EVCGSRLSTFCPQPAKRTLSGPAAEASAGQRATIASRTVLQRRQLHNCRRFIWFSLLVVARCSMARGPGGRTSRVQPACHDRVHPREPVQVDRRITVSTYTIIGGGRSLPS